ncbi:thiamine biosynthesis lipoprotein [Sphingomonas laterariae]|uniref:FAD:protein FMN transferase n=1 Tax=Edaphosphingomonas laterariae TaxID=861865 RepID=A0A239EF56_9SPHN|nr:FAD:protein FMN transferase [Sphingomonas laterariae]SNS43061.1 thiamine biosynthesis lipoprotein [Sphingomonas laterariae]
MAEPHILIPPDLSRQAFDARIADGRIVALGGRTMGTSWSAKIVATQSLAGMQALLETLLDRVIAEMSNWETTSDISRFNRAPAGRWQALPPDFFTVLRRALDIAAASGGAFDPTAGALVDLWGFGPAPARLAPPSDTEIAAALAAAGHGRIAIDIHARRAQQPGGLVLDLSGIAKGFAVDLLAEHLRVAGHRHFLVEVGGELVGEGVTPDGQPWWVDLEAPPGNLVPPARIALHGLAIATTGDYRRYFDHDGQRYAHSIDPRSGRPVANGVASVSVVHRRCMDADAWATALTVLGMDQGMALAIEQGLAARFISNEGGEAFSPALAAMLD